MAALTPSDPQRLGRYWLAGRLGAGGQGVVYEAYGEAGERVAVKVPRLDDALSRSRLAKEAQAAQRVASFCTARVIEAATEVAQPYIVSEYVPGPNLRQVIADGGPYCADVLRRLAIGVATALTAIHQAGVVHRDLKPDNIILGPDGPRVIDFGVAREAGPTTTGPVMGTPNYMAPEVLSGRGATPAADVWAWGLVVLFAAEGRDAVEAREPMATVTSVLDFTPDVSALPEPLQGLVAAALARDPAERPAARSLLLALLGGSDDPLQDGGSAAAPLTGERPDPDLGEIAEELYQELSEDERSLAPEVFLRMVAGDESIRQVPRAELEGAESILSLYSAAGLVTESDAAYTLAQPALIQAWPRMRQWVADNRAGLPIHRRLTEAAVFWDGHGRKPGDLLHGSVLDSTLRWAATERRDITLVGLEKEFLDSAARQTRRQSRRRGMISAALGVLLVAALGGLGLAEYRRGVTDRQLDEATARALALRAADLREGAPKLAMRLSVAAWRLAPGLPQSRGALYDSLAQRRTDVFTDPASTADTVHGLSHDGRILMSARAGQVTLWDVRTHIRTREFSGVSPTAAKVALSHDGTTLAVQDDRSVRLWDVATGAPVGSAFAGGAFAGSLGALEFDQEGRFLSVPQDDTSRWWRLSGRERVTTPSGAPVDVLSPGGRLGLVFTWGNDDGRAQLWDLERGRRLKADWLPRRSDLKEASFGTDGRSLVFVEQDHDPAANTSTVKVYDARTGKDRLAAHGPVDGDAMLVFGGRFVVVKEMGGLNLVRLSGPHVVVDRGMQLEVGGIRADDADGVLRLRTSPATVVTLDVRDLIAPSALPGSPTGTALLSPDASTLALATDESVSLWDVRLARRIGTAVPLSGDNVMGPPGMAFSGDGRKLAIAGKLQDTAPEHGVALVDVATGATLQTRPVDVGKLVNLIEGVALNATGTMLAVSPDVLETDGGPVPVQVWELGAGMTRRDLAVEGSQSMAFRPDGRLLVTGLFPEAMIVDPAKGTRFPSPSGINGGAFAFSRDGAKLVVSSGERMTVWSGSFDRPAGSPFLGTGATGPVTIAWSPDGRTVAAYEGGDRIRLWDEPSRQALGLAFDGLADEGFLDSASIAFSADGKTLYSSTPEGVVRAHPIDGDAAAAAVCARAGGAGDPEEWRTQVPEAEPFEIC